MASNNMLQALMVIKPNSSLSEMYLRMLRLLEAFSSDSV